MNRALIHAFALTVHNGAQPSPPVDIQWMPPGRHRIRASKNGKPATIDVNVTADVAARVAADLEAMKAAGRRPYLDFNHEGGRASARVVAVRWGGDDPVSGGIRAEVEWTPAGVAALQGREFFSFSPTFTVDERTNAVTGVNANMGGLVNDPAFTEIQPVAASAATDTDPSTTTMNKLLTTLASLGLLPSTDLADDAAAAAVSAAFAPYKAAQADLVAARAENAALTATVQAARKDAAARTVQAAVAAGKIPGKNPAVLEYWQNAIVTSGKAAEDALDAMPVNPVLEEEAVTVKVTAGSTAEVNAKASKAAEQNRMIAEYRAKHPKATFDEAWEASAKAAPAVFKED